MLLFPGVLIALVQLDRMPFPEDDRREIEAALYVLLEGPARTEILSPPPVGIGRRWALAN